jgi:non-ribosomal peptide synthetase component F
MMRARHGQHSAAGRFEARLKQSPRSIALIEDESLATWTYDALQAKSIRAAQQIEELTPGSVLALYGGTVPDIIAYTLAAWRLRLIPAVLDRGMPPRAVNSLVSNYRLAYLNLDASGQHAVFAAGGAVADPDEVSHTTFTSGSTGTPKGVLISHAGFANLLDWHQYRYQNSEDDRVSFFSNPGFDAFFKEVWSALTSGATGVVPGRAFQPTPNSIRHFWETHRITQSDVPVRVLEMIIEDGQWPTPLREVITGGDAISLWPQHGNGPRITNEYGPTEMTVTATASGDLRYCERYTTTPPMGRPLPGVQAMIHVLGDPHPQHPSPGLTGELWLTGVQLTIGYLTPEGSHVSDEPFDLHNGHRWYRTGDLVTVIENGELHFQGRLDTGFAKVNGYRVDLREIEARTLELDGVHQCAAVVVGSSGRPALALGYVGDPQPSVVRDFLAERLPKGSLPSRFRRLREIPLTRRGKQNDSELRDQLATDAQL